VANTCWEIDKERREADDLVHRLTMEFKVGLGSGLAEATFVAALFHYASDLKSRCGTHSQ
jgi:hypothetical protein